MNKSIKVKASEVKSVLAIVGVKTRKKVSVTPTTEVLLSNRYWSDGNKSEYIAINLENLKTSQATDVNPMFNVGNDKVQLERNILIFETRHFQGYVSYSIHVHPKTLPVLLPNAKDLEV